MSYTPGVVSTVLCALALGLGAAEAQAQRPIQKCVSADGKVTYQDTACVAGKVVGEIQRDTRAADPAALRRASADRNRAAAAVAARAAIASTDAEREVAAHTLDRYLSAAANGDNEERCKLAGQLSDEMRAANNDAGYQRWDRYRENDCANASDPQRAAQAEATGQNGVPEELRSLLLGAPLPGATGPAGRDAQGSTANPPAPGTRPVPGIRQSPAPCNTPLCR